MKTTTRTMTPVTCSGALLVVTCLLSCRESEPQIQNEDPRWTVLKAIGDVTGTQRHEFTDTEGRFGGGVIFVDLDKSGTSCSVTLHRGMSNKYLIGKSKVEIVNIEDARHFAAILGRERVNADASGISSAYTRSLRSAELTLAASRREAIEEDEKPNPYLPEEITPKRK